MCDSMPEEDRQHMYVRTVKLLRAASEIAGGDAALAKHLGIEDALLNKLMSGQHKLPKGMLLATVDIILANRESHPRFSRKPVVPLARQQVGGD